ncbi:hypothetical protein QWJ34_13895 [Saccharibacillus sp. CPCC 101409]|uniref:hypothetical protein n=1 Tax=Saccharibacillus sp. CPCC 101409 TaxID=3058041 RepID=UPI00267418BC|nr:hypothetical protein [Saccharibacillus sp. CPCC 101409]MDO3410860.1 hypothetical protein [Saccharibacillus sp. CPCC 101409]
MKKISILAMTALTGMSLLAAGCGQKEAAAPAETSTGNTASAAAADAGPVKMGRVEEAAHGTKSFTVAVAAVQGDKIVGASLDDYQFMGSDVATGVPNSDDEFGEGYKDPKVVLASKLANADYYSDLMKDHAKATKRIDDSLHELEAFATGKTIAELESALEGKSPEEMVDAVSGATLQDTKGYLTAILDAAKAAK